MATITDVARMAGVSSSTVSHVLNGTRYVSPLKRKAVEDAIRESGYTPNTLARALASATTNSVGIAVSAIGNPFFTDIIRAIEKECVELGMTVFLSDTQDDPERELAVVRALHQRRVDGIILASSATDRSHAAIDYLRDNAVPAVLVDRLASTAFDQVGVANAEAVDLLVAHLAGLGHRRIAFVPGQPFFATTRERTEGFRAALARRGLPAVDDHVAPASDSMDAAARSIQRIMALAEPPTAVIAGNNLATIGAMRGLKRLGVRVPDDVAFVGFDDFEWTDCFEPQLTVVAQPCAEIGATAAAMLLDRLRNPAAPPRTMRLQASLVVRNSCGSGLGGTRPRLDGGYRAGETGGS